MRCFPCYPVLSVALRMAALCVVSPFTGTSALDRSDPPLPPPPSLALAQNLIFRFLQTRQRVEVWLYAATDTRMRGFIVGFDEYMNVVLDEAVEVSLKRKTYVWVRTRACPSLAPALWLWRPCRCTGWGGWAEVGARAVAFLQPASRTLTVVFWCGSLLFLCLAWLATYPPLPPPSLGAPQGDASRADSAQG